METSLHVIAFIILTQVNDSSPLLQTCLVNEGKLSMSQSLDLYPEMSFTDDKGKTHTDKYFIMLGEDGNKKRVLLAERRFAQFLVVQLYICTRNVQCFAGRLVQQK